MATWERQNLRYKPPSFSSSLLDAIYHSIDDQPPQSLRRNNAAQVEEDVESLRRAIMIEKWIESHTNNNSSKPSHFPTNSTDSDSSAASRSSPKIFMRTKTKAQKIYGELKKVKEPISPGGKISNFLNSIFSSRSLKSGTEDWSSMRKSRSMKDTTTCSSSTSRSCLSKNASSGGNSKSKSRSVRFCPVSVILDQDSKPCGHKSLYDDEIRNVEQKNRTDNIDQGKNLRKHGMREYDLDNMSCGSSDLFELEELPVYGTTRIEMNHAIATRVVI